MWSKTKSSVLKSNVSNSPQLFQKIKISILKATYYILRHYAFQNQPKMGRDFQTVVFFVMPLKGSHKNPLRMNLCKIIACLYWFCVSLNLFTLKQTQSENGNVARTIAQDIAVKIHPHIPIPSSVSSAATKNHR